MTVAGRYDLVNGALFLPWGGSRRLRRRLVALLDVHAGQRVLELGCGTGQVTEVLVDAGADVIALDALPDMLAGARRRAPAATFVEGDALHAEVGSGYHRVVLAFVLHNMDAEDRRRLLTRARRALDDAGQVGVVEWARPPGRVRAETWRRFLARLEPSPTVHQVLDGALDVDIAASGLRTSRRLLAAGGRVELRALARA
jgi:demethylmenaquinone methyltransferase/2-methoxy-6-polyprenyl-1,4-benzoquinol methylase